MSIRKAFARLARPVTALAVLLAAALAALPRGKPAELGRFLAARLARGTPALDQAPRDGENAEEARLAAAGAEDVPLNGDEFGPSQDGSGGGSWKWDLQDAVSDGRRSWWVVERGADGGARLSLIGDGGPDAALAPPASADIAPAARLRAGAARKTVTQALTGAPSSEASPGSGSGGPQSRAGSRADPARSGKDAESARGGRSRDRAPAAGSAGGRRLSLITSSPKAAVRSQRAMPLARPAPGRRFRPILLSVLMGKGAIRPPKGRFQPPDFKPLRGKIPAADPEGRRLSQQPPTPAEIESVAPPEAPPPAKACSHISQPHWHGPYHHAATALGRATESGWAWLKQGGGRWWIEALEEERISLVRHASRWWWKSNGVWFLLHQGQPWGYRHFEQWGLDGLVQPQSGAQMIYSADGSRVALVTPGAGAVVFDAHTGSVIARLSEEQVPRRPKPRAPASLSFPP